jgi:hypothetical protein
MEDPRRKTRRTFAPAPVQAPARTPSRMAPAPVQAPQERSGQAQEVLRRFAEWASNDPRVILAEQETDGRPSIRATPASPADRVLAMLPEGAERAARRVSRSFDRGPVGTAMRMVRESDPSELVADAAGGPLIRVGRAARAARVVDDLPMDEASRLARARELGFDVDQPLYHGSGANIFAFEPRRAGKNMQMNLPGVHLATDPKFASLYADRRGGNVYDVFARPGKQLDATKLVVEGTEEAQIVNALTKGTRKKPYWSNAAYKDETGPRITAPLSVYIDENPNKAIKELKERGYDSVLYKAESRSFNSPNSYTLHGSSPTLLVFDPKNIRSRRARFDPAQRESADLLAGLALPALFTGGAVANQRKNRED